jgi:hypothetical protein
MTLTRQRLWLKCLAQDVNPKVLDTRKLGPSLMILTLLERQTPNIKLEPSVDGPTSRRGRRGEETRLVEKKGLAAADIYGGHACFKIGFCQGIGLNSAFFLSGMSASA